jgi:hypothetical protein
MQGLQDFSFVRTFPIHRHPCIAASGEMQLGNTDGYAHIVRRCSISALRRCRLEGSDRKAQLDVTLRCTSFEDSCREF